MRVALGGLGLVASAVAGLAGLVLGIAPAGTALGAWLAAFAATVTYRPLAGPGRRAVPALAPALLGVAAAAWTVRAVLDLADVPADLDRVNPITLLAVAVSAAGIVLLAWAARRAGVVPVAAGVAIAVVAALSPLGADPAMPYLVGAGPLGAALLLAAARHRPSAGPPAPTHPAGHRAGSGESHTSEGSRT